MRRGFLPALGVWCLLSGAAAAQISPIRSVVVQPDQFEGKTVSVIGQFRGRNLFGDLPDPPSGEDEGFVLRSGETAIWVFGVPPRGKDFSLDPTRRVDAGLWLKVTGTVERARGSVWIKGRAVERAAPREEPVVAIAVPLPPVPVDVVFSAPIGGEVDVRLDTRIRIQLSEVLDADTLKDRIRVTYAKSDSADPVEAQPPAVAFVVNYASDMRAIEIVPAAPLERFRELTVELLEGITSSAGAVLKPWRLTFTTGGPPNHERDHDSTKGTTTARK